MSIVDKVVAAVTPEPSEKDRAEARTRARAAAGAGDGWLAMVLDHHLRIESAFAAVKDAPDPQAQRKEQKRLALLLSGHSLAEETVLYPAMALTDQKVHATSAYTQQSAAKVNLAALDELECLSKEYMDKLEHLRAAVSHHVYEEESKWFPELLADADSKNVQLTKRYREEFERYMGADARSM